VEVRAAVPPAVEMDSGNAYEFRDVDGRRLSPFWREWLDKHPEVPLDPVPIKESP